ncbi:TIGR02391 family protein [Streptomyces sp. NPDC005547]|uniref:TIGR02391 family protein n=1 Tax=Streptomyces sp. NPDC005547 TaxID=3154887 RepID=UPI0033A67C79
MNHAYAVEKLTGYLTDVNALLAEMDLTNYEAGIDWPDWPQELVVGLPLIRGIVTAYNPLALAELHQYDSHERGHWHFVRLAVTEALGQAQSADELAAFLRPTSPSIAADALHPWVWESAAPLWAAEAHQDAVLAAARVINRRLQLKVGRHDAADKNLCMQSFSIKEPVAGQPRLRFDGDSDSPTWVARQEGAMYLSAGAFLAIRNLAAHAEAVAWTEQEALEYLAVFSVVARWIEECSVETAS